MIRGRTFAAIFLLLQILWFCGCGLSGPQAPRAEDATIDLRAWNFARDGVVRLDGEWEWYWQRLLDLDVEGRAQEGIKPTGHYSLPQVWNGRVVDGKTLTGNGYATFRLRVLITPGTSYAFIARFCSGAYRLYWNGEPIAASGILGRSRATSVNGCVTQTPSFIATSADNILTLQVSNFHHARGGPRSGLLLGHSPQIHTIHQRRIVIDAFIVGGLCLITFYGFSIYLLNRRERSPLYLGVCCWLIGLWIGAQGPLLLTTIFPQLSWSTLIHIEYLGLYLAPVAFGPLVRSFYPREAPRWMFDLFSVVFVSLAVTVLLLPPWQFTRTLFFYTFMCNLFGAFCLGVAVRALSRREIDAILSVTGFLPIWIGLAADAFATFYPQNYNALTPIGMTMMVLVQLLVLSRRSARAHQMIEEQAHLLVRLNTAYYRFVPKEFLRLLGKDDILSVQLGDQVQREMTVLFADVRGFTSLSEKLSPEENFAFVNSLLGGLGPLIRKHRGFIDKYLGDGIMALFPNRPADAVLAAFEIRGVLLKLNERRSARGEVPVRIGIGIHKGSIMLGTVGEPRRMDGTVISDVVNTSSRLESLTKLYGVTVLLSEQVVGALPKELAENTRVLGRVRAKGKRQPITVYEFFDGDPPEEAEKKRSGRQRFLAGLLYYQRGEFRAAANAFAAICAEDSADSAAQYYHERARKLLGEKLQGASGEWDGVEVITEK